MRSLPVVAAVAVALAGLQADPARAALSARGDGPADPTRPGLIAAVARGRSVIVHAAPGGKSVTRVRDRTRFGSPMTLAVLGQRGRWLEIRTETGRRGWVLQSESLRLRTTGYRLIVSLAARRLELRDGRRLVLRTAVAVGRRSSPTPTGHFGITDRLAGRRFGSAYGCCILALSAVQRRLPPGWSGGNRIAIHGTNAPGSVGAATSSGCMRLDERPVRLLMRRLPLGTPVIIR